MLSAHVALIFLNPNHQTSILISYCCQPDCIQLYRTFSISQMCRTKLASAMSWREKGARKRTFSIRQMRRVKIAWAMPWRDKVRSGEKQCHWAQWELVLILPSTACFIENIIIISLNIKLDANKKGGRGNTLLLYSRFYAFTTKPPCLLFPSQA